jgi:hypothetical protein
VFGAFGVFGGVGAVEAEGGGVGVLAGSGDGAGVLAGAGRGGAGGGALTSRTVLRALSRVVSEYANAVKSQKHWVKTSKPTIIPSRTLDV